MPGKGITGGVRVVFEYANRLSDRGHDVTILYPTVPPRMAEIWMNPKSKATQAVGTLIRLVTRNEADWFDLNVPIYQIPTLSTKMIGYFEDSIPDADITIATAWETAYTVAALSENKGKKGYFVQHYEIWKTWNSDEAWDQVESICDDSASYPLEMYEVTPPGYNAQREKAAVERSYELSLDKITISSWLETLLRTKFDEEVIDVVPNSVNHSIFYPNSNLDSGPCSLLLPYRDASWKGQREVKDIVHEYKNTDVEIHTYGSGNGSDLPQYVEHHSNISDEELRQLYTSADIFILTAWVEGFGLPPLEAMACKCAVVTTNVGSVSDYAEDGETASIVPPRDSQALVQAIDELVNDREERHKLQKQGYNQVNKYTWEDATAQFESAIRRIISN